MGKYRIISVTRNEERDESVGSKQKFWFQDNTGASWLFKYARQNTGEDWSEKIAEQIAGLLGLPHAVVELADFEGSKGSVSLDFTEGQKKGELLLGNRLLLETDPSYPLEKTYRVAQHTLEKVFSALNNEFIHMPDGFANSDFKKPAEVFIGYLLLDALIGNTDRHHQNWAIIEKNQIGGVRYATLAPTFDHASSLGRELLDETLVEWERDISARVEKYTQKTTSALYKSSTDSKPLSPLDAFSHGSSYFPNAGRHWLSRLSRLSDRELAEKIQLVPQERMSNLSRHFAENMLRCNRGRLLSLGV